MAIKIIVAFIILLLISVFVLVFLVIAKPDVFKKKTKQVNSSRDVSYSEKGDTKDFIPVVKFEKNAIELGNGSFKAIIECSSINYSLLSEMEKKVIDSSFIRMLNTLTFPYDFYIQTREYDSELMLENLHSNVLKSIKRFPSVANYAKVYEERMRNLTSYIGNSKIKKKYMIISYSMDELTDVSALTREEIREFMLEELLNRANITVNALMSIGISAKILEKNEIAECLYAYYNRDATSLVKELFSGIYTSFAVESEEDEYVTKMDRILSETQKHIQLELFKPTSSKEELEFYKYVYMCLEQYKSVPNMNAYELLNMAVSSVEKDFFDNYGTSQVGDIDPMAYQKINNYYNQMQGGV